MSITEEMKNSLNESAVVVFQKICRYADRTSESFRPNYPFDRLLRDQATTAADTLAIKIVLWHSMQITGQHLTNFVANRFSGRTKTAKLAYTSSSQGGELWQKKETIYTLRKH